MTPGLIIIGGHPRSGTTMFNRIMNSHPAIWSTYEFRTFLFPNARYNKHMETIRTDWLERSIVPLQLRGRLLRRLASGAFVYRYRRLIRSYRNDRVTSEAIAGVLDKIAPGRQWIGDKYPGYVFKLDKLVKLPGAAIIVLYRDVRDVYLSTWNMSQTAWKGKLTRQGRRMDQNMANPRHVAERWVEAIELMERHQGRVLPVRYEAFATDPDSAIIPVAEALKVDPAGFKLGRVHADSIGKFERGLSQEQLTTIEDVAGSVMQRHGYHPVTE